ncbi:class I SAM-dependent methyltransferase [Candidatus Woesebacteria bacterium]|nr:class I SAM-dependent methyltransferase [Candidatus Woesebacteria bacterium]
MKLTPQEQETIDAYDQNAAAWAGSRNQKGVWGNEKKKFFEYLPSGKIIEIGSGSGRDAQELIAHGYEYIGTDISKGLLEIAKKRNPHASFSLQSVYNLDFPDGTFDGFWASAVLLHIPKNRIDEALQHLKRILKDGATGFISLKKGDGEKMVDGDHVGIDYKRFFSFYEQPEFTEILQRNHFEILETYVFDHSNKKWLAFFVKKI